MIQLQHSRVPDIIIRPNNYFKSIPHCYNCLNDVWWRITLFTDQFIIHGKKMFKNKLHKNTSIFSNTQQQNLKSQTRNPAVDHWTTQQLLPNTFSLEQWWEDFSSPISYDIVLYSSYNFQNWGFEFFIIFFLHELTMFLLFEIA